MIIHAIIMASPKRRDMAHALLDILDKQGFESASILWDQKQDEWDTGQRCLEYAAELKGDYSLIIQDDAVISQHLYKSLVSMLLVAPDGLISLYTGKIKPHPNAVLKAVEKAEEIGASFLTVPALLWGVGYILPTRDVKPLLGTLKNLAGLYDARIGRAYKRMGGKVYYSYPSLVDHDDKGDSIVGTVAKEPRKAHRYDPSLVTNWNDKVVAIF